MILLEFEHHAKRMIIKAIVQWIPPATAAKPSHQRTDQ